MLVNVRQRVYKTIDGYGYYSDSIVPVEGDLGSRMLDKNGQEIYSNDKVKTNNDSREYTVRFVRGAFYVGDKLLSEVLDQIEIVGRVLN